MIVFFISYINKSIYNFYINMKKENLCHNQNKNAILEYLKMSKFFIDYLFCDKRYI